MSAGGQTTVKNFYLQAREACASPNAEQPFMCFDLTFISVLLEYGLGLRPSTTVRVSIYIYAFLQDSLKLIQT